MNIYNLKELLRKDIFDYRFRISSLQEEREILEESLKDLEKGKISPKAKDIVYDKYRLSLNPYNFKDFLSTLKNDLFIVDTNLTILNNILTSTINAYQALHYHKILSPNLMTFVKNRLLKEKLNDLDIIKTMEFIKIHNAKCHEDKSISLSSDDLYLVLNMLNSGYEEIKIEPMNNEKLENYIKAVINAIESNPISSITNILQFGNLTLKEQEYVFKKVLKYYQDEIYSLIILLKDKEFYFNISILQSIKEEYKILYQKYMLIRKKLDDLLFNKLEKQDIELDPEITEKSQNINEGGVHLYYSTNSIDPMKCYFVKDIQKMREESYSAILDMIDTFTSGNAKNAKYLSTNSNFMELKNDQIRIVLKPMGNNNYSVQGVFIKKSDNDRLTYNNMFNRPIATIDDEYSRKVEQYYEEYLQENRRKGSR